MAYSACSSFFLRKTRNFSCHSRRCRGARDGAPVIAIMACDGVVWNRPQPLAHGLRVSKTRWVPGPMTYASVIRAFAMAQATGATVMAIVGARAGIGSSHRTGATTATIDMPEAHDHPAKSWQTCKERALWKSIVPSFSVSYTARRGFSVRERQELDRRDMRRAERKTTRKHR